MRPPIVPWLVDDQGHSNVGYNNGQNAATPHMDRVSSDGIRLERLYSENWCAPSRASLLTSHHPTTRLHGTGHDRTG